MAANPFGNEPPILSRCHTNLRSTLSGENKLTRLLAVCSQVIIEGLSRLLAQFEPDWPTSFLLSHSCTIY